MIIQETEEVKPRRFTRPEDLAIATTGNRNNVVVAPHLEFDPYTFIINSLKQLKEKVQEDDANEERDDTFGFREQFMSIAMNFLQNGINRFEALRDAPTE